MCLVLKIQYIYIKYADITIDAEFVITDEWRKRFNTSGDDKPWMKDSRFARMWNMYLSRCYVDFKSRNMNALQIVYTKKGLTNTYIRPT